MIYRSPRPSVTVPDTALTPFVLRHAARLADKPALIDGVTGQTLTYSQLAAAIARTAAGLTAQGFRNEDVLAIYAPNCLEYPIAFHAAASLGGIVTTINPSYTAGELACQLNDASARYLLTTPELMANAGEAAARTGVEAIVVTGEAPGAIPFTSLAGPGNPPTVAADPAHDLVALPYSSGTTGLPKGVGLTHANLVANIAQLEGCGLILETDTLIGILPFFHAYGLTVLMNLSLASGATVVILPRFELESFLRTLERYAVTFVPVVPPVMVALAKAPMVDRFDLSPLRAIASGGAPLGAELTAACRTRLGCHIIQGFGMTETSAVTHLSSTDPERTTMGSVGALIPNTEAMLVDLASGIALGPNEQGELWLRGPQVMKGYLNRTDATTAMIDADGWLHTGDIGYADAAGNFFVVDRLKELIKYKGYQVAPAELEAILLSHPAVADAAVIPSPDEEAGEVPKAFVVLKSEATAGALMAFVAGQVAPYKKIRRMEFIDVIPKSASGKILRRVLVERERAALAVLV